METDEIKAAIKNMSVAERREVGRYILELEKEQLQADLPEDLKRLSRVIQDEAERLKQVILDEVEKFKRKK